ncbi:MAG: RiPP maturation radical SAM C-methyltransferase [Desulfobacterales bacterium]|nr:RiPP maturation radical SAM C-methyltransferase [Desulfobacterales bacterium]
MPSSPSEPVKALALISAPWPLHSRPSVQLGVLKAYLRQQFPSLQVDAHHLYLSVAREVGYKLYEQISARTWLAESVFAALLFPDRHGEARKLFVRESRGPRRLAGADFDRLVITVGELAERWLDSVDGSSWLLAGFSNSLCQFTATLYFIRCLKRRWPALPTVLGGAGLVPAAADSLRVAFPEIDFVVSGEGERPLAALVAHLLQGRPASAVTPVAGVNAPGSESDGAGFDQMPDLADLPVPDYEDYFALLGTFSSKDRFFPTLGVEMSRGCWWRGRHAEDGLSGCRFCNLNLQWQGYRFKGAGQVVAEVAALTRRHQVLSVAFMDNVLPLSGGPETFGGLAALKMDLALFAEIRATTARDDLEIMRRAGLREVQIGIEALSSRLLKKLNKGTRAIDNLEIMRHCQELGIVNRSNLLLEFPGSDADDVAETLQNLTFATWFKPLRPVSFWLGCGSPVWQARRGYGMRAVFNHPNYAAIFPEGPLRGLCHMIQAYRGDRGHQRVLWRPVRRGVAEWKSQYNALSGNGREQPLSYRDGRDFIIIYQRRVNADRLNHRLTGLSRKIYLYCLHHRSVPSILQRFGGIDAGRLMPFLREMVAKRLMFEENSRYLSLAVNSGGARSI